MAGRTRIHHPGPNLPVHAKMVGVPVDDESGAWISGTQSGVPVRGTPGAMTVLYDQAAPGKLERRLPRQGLEPVGFARVPLVDGIVVATNEHYRTPRLQIVQNAPCPDVTCVHCVVAIRHQRGHSFVEVPVGI